MPTAEHLPAADWQLAGAAVVAGVNTTGVNVAVPEGAEPGDVLVLSISGYTAGLINELAGWRSGGWETLYNGGAGGYGTIRCYLAVHQLTGDDPASWTLTATSPWWPVGWVMAVRGGSGRVLAHAVRTASARQTILAPPDINLAESDTSAVVYGWGGCDSRTTINVGLELPAGQPGQLGTTGPHNQASGGACYGLSLIIGGQQPDPATVASEVAMFDVAVELEAAAEPEPPEPPGLPEPVRYRRYDRRYDDPDTWGYGPRHRPPARVLVGIVWDGLPLNPGNLADGSTIAVENVEGWDDSPPLAGRDAERSIADGAAWGPKTLGARLVTIDGAAAGQPGQLGAFRDQLARRAAARIPAELGIADRVATVRAGTELLRVHWHGDELLRYQVVLTAADPVLYDVTWQTALLGVVTEDTGRAYPRGYPWQYAQPFVGNSVIVANGGNHPAPVFALYRGELSASSLTDGAGGIIRVAPLAAGMEIRIATATLIAEAAGGAGRASYILPGSRPMAVPASGSSRWHLYASGGGTVELAWRSSWV